MKIHLVDGTYELFRSFFGAPPQTAPDGQEVGATRGLLRSMLSLLSHEGATHVAIAFDTRIESFRNDLFPGYKTGEGIDPQLLGQFPLVERAAYALGLTVWSMVEFEADDALATGAHRWAANPEVDQIVICTPDKDLAQCITGNRVVGLDRRRSILLDEPGVVEKFGVSPASIPDWLALVGDNADGIPGLRGWGAKSSSTLLARYHHLESIPEKAEDWQVAVRGAAKLAATLAASRQDVLLYRQLATLRTDVPLTETVEDLEWQGARRGLLEALCEELGDRSFPQRIPRWRSDED